MTKTNGTLEKQNGSAGNVLIVDDNPANLHLLSELLTKRGYKVRPASSGVLALISIKSILPDVILLDIKMPKMDGYEVCRRLKADMETCHVPVLFVSALSDLTEKIKGFNAGAVDYIIKPFQQEEVLARVNTHVTLSRMTQFLEQQVAERTFELTKTIKKLDAEIKKRNRTEIKKNRLLEAVRQVEESIVITDIKGIIQFVNPAFEKMSGFNSSECLGMNMGILQSEILDASFYRKVRKRLMTGETWKGEFANQRKNGEVFTARVTISPVFDKRCKIINFIAVTNDVTKQRMMEDQLRHAQQMEIVGRLAGGVAHDFNNMLCVIQGTAQLLLHKDGLDSEMRYDVQQIQTAANRSSDITQQLLTFSRKQVTAPKVVALNPLINDIIKMLSRLLGEDVDILFSTDMKDANIYVDAGQFNQILSNLCINARDAMVDGGRLLIETTRISINEEDCEQKIVCKSGDYVVVTVSDNGSGICEKDLPHIFEPFFTTKDQGKGTGLGLASVYGAMQQNNGFVNVESQLGKGTKFSLYFPKSSEKVQYTNSSEGKTVFMNPLNILLVEDNNMVLDLTRKMLNNLGHSVCVAEFPEKALAICRENRVAFDLLLSDVIMPQMSGKKLQKLVEKLQPSIKTLFMSGYVGNKTIARDSIVDGNIMFLQKPFSMAELSAKINEAVL